MARLSLKVNDASFTVDSAPSTPLLYVLRDELGLNGPRYGCGQEHCGACRVMIDGDLAYSCTFSAGDAAGRAVTTVEGIGTTERPHPLQQVFLDFNAAQCGFCSSGIIVAAWHLLEHNSDPSREDITAALEPHLCRCGAHNRVIRAVMAAAERVRQTR